MITIVGCGLSGLIAANMLGDEVTEIAEADAELPNKHKALLRFRSSIVGDTVNIPFRKVKVMKTSQHWKNPVADAISYSIKSTGKANLRSVISADDKIVDRYIAPDDFISRLASRVSEKIKFERSMIAVLQDRKDNSPIISTIPMYSLMRALDYPNIPEFNSRPGSVLTYDLPETFDICVTVYVPIPWYLPYRLSITGNKLIVEASGNINTKDDVLNMIECTTEYLGLDIDCDEMLAKAKVSSMKFAKISEIDDDVRKTFIMWASREHNIYSLGRYACWRPTLLLDDLIQDVRKIQRMIGGDKSHQYEQMKAK